MFQGSYNDMLKTAQTYTGKYLSGKMEVPVPVRRRQWRNAIEIVKARENNLKNLSLSIPLRQLNVVTGVSGSGKSTLAFDIVFAEGQRVIVFLGSQGPQLPWLLGLGQGVYRVSEHGSGPTVQAARDAVVLDESLNEVPPGSGTAGRLARRGNVPVAYYKDPEKSAATFVVGPSGDRYALAGDMAVHEADGTITLLGRGSQCINSGGEKIFPEEVEAALKAHPAVFDAIVVGVPDDRWGQRVAAVVQPRQGLTPSIDDLDRHCREYVAAYKVPKEVHLVPEVVRSPSGKPDYPWAAKVARGETID